MKVDIKDLPVEYQFKLMSQARRGKDFQDWVITLLTVLMSASIVIEPINRWLDKMAPINPIAVVKSAGKESAQVQVKTGGEWKTKMYSGVPLGKGLYGGQRGYNPNAIHPIYGTVRPHLGWDIGATYGMPLYVVTRGKTAKVTCLYEPGGAGYYALIEPDSDKDTVFVTMHMIQGTCRSGVLKRGTQMGQVGSTGSSTGPHIHFEYRVNGNRIWPMVEQVKQHINGN
jgi:murein DD-endopeptidase MepM/ murein hydrolase activator NlpD